MLLHFVSYIYLNQFNFERALSGIADVTGSVKIKEQHTALLYNYTTDLNSYKAHIQLAEMNFLSTGNSTNSWQHFYL